ncbi:MAG: N-acetyltransferase family protein [Nitrososphaerales archaeon]
MTTIRRASLPEDRPAIAELFGEYLRWVCSRIYAEYAATFDAESILAHDLETLQIFMPPNGFLLLAFVGDTAAGCACTRKIGDGIAELKRTYVRPSFRRHGIGRLLVAETIREAKRLGFHRLRLDSAGFMSEAHTLYRSCGFQDRAPYDESEIPVEYRKHWVFMELDLTSQEGQG